jgi:hypothetical protein
MPVQGSIFGFGNNDGGEDVLNPNHSGVKRDMRLLRPSMEGASHHHWSTAFQIAIANGASTFDVSGAIMTPILRGRHIQPQLE